MQKLAAADMLKALIRGGADLKIVEARIEVLKSRRIPGCNQALEFLDEIIEMIEE